MKEQIKEYQSEFSKNISRNKFLAKELKRLRNLEALPRIKEKYEKKYFKYKTVIDQENEWWLYSYCIQVTKDNQGIFNRFETKPFAAGYKIAEKGHFHECQIEITKKEYMQAFKEFKGSFKDIAKDLGKCK